MRYRKAIKSGVGGWLAFFILTIGVISPGSAIILAVLRGRPKVAVDVEGPLTLWNGDVGITLCEAGAQVAIAILLLRRRRRSSVRITVAALWSLAIADILLRRLLAAFAFHVPFLTGWLWAGLSTWRPLIFATVWSAYLLRSQRVANTYPVRRGSTHALDEIFA